MNEQDPLLDLVVELTVERDAHRLVAQQAIHALHALGNEHNRLQDRHRRLIDEYRALRVQLLRGAAA